MRYRTKVNLIMLAAMLLAGAGTIAVLTLLPEGGAHLALVALWALLVIIAAVAALTAVMRSHFRTASTLLLDQCDADGFLREIYAAIHPSKADNPPFLFAMMLYDTRYAQGHYGEALRGLRETRIRYPGRTGRAYRAIWLLNLAEVSRALGRFAEAQDALDESLALVQHGEFKPAGQKLLLHGIEHEKLLLSIRQGCLEGAEEALQAHLSEAKNEYGRVNAYHWLGEVYAQQGETEKAREAWEYVASHGGALYYAALAREALGLPPEPDIARLWRREG